MLAAGKVQNRKYHVEKQCENRMQEKTEINIMTV
jgi:hypothetical protein